MHSQRWTARAPMRRAAIGLAVLALAAAPVMAVAPPSSADGTTQVLGDFETGMDGWTPSVNGGATQNTTLSSDAHTGSQALSLDMSFTKDDDFVSMTKGFTPQTVTGLSFWVKSCGLEKLTVRFIDATNETHQQEVALADTPEWQQVTITDPGGGTNHTSWSGDGDGVFEQPASSVAITAPAWGIRNEPRTKATLTVDDIVAQTGGDVPTSGITLTPLTLGNVFTGSQAPRVGISTTAAQVNWSLADAYGTTVASGQAATADLHGTLTLPDPGMGFFRLTVSDASGAQGQASTTLARLSDFDVKSVSSSPFGVATHFSSAWDPQIVPLVADAGIKQVRDEAYWSQAETTKGTITWPAQVAQYRDKLHQAGLNELLVLDYGNDIYGDDAYPVTDAGRAAYARYAQQAARTFGSDNTSYEIWNEWNIAIGGLPAADKSASTYAGALKAAYQAIKAVQPNATVVGPAMAGVDPDWLGQLFAAGGLNYLDSVSIHPYTYPNPAEGIDQYLSTTQQVIKQYSGGRDVPITVSEMGFPTGTGARAMPDTDEASNQVRAGVIALSHKVANYTVYDFKDDGTDPSDTEQRFGLIHNENDPEGAYTPKPAYVAVSTMTRQLTGWDYAGSDRRNDVWDYRFTKGSDATRVAWSTTPTTVSYSAAGPVTLTTLYGATQTLTPDAAGLITVSLGTDPIYLTGATTPASVVRNTLQAPAALRGVDVPVTWTVDNTTGSTDAHVTLSLDSTTTQADVPAGKSVTRTVMLPAFSSTGTFHLTGTTTENGQQSSRIDLAVQVTEPISVTARHQVDAQGQESLLVTASNAGKQPLEVDKVTGTVAGQQGDYLAGTTIPGQGSASVSVPLTGLTAGACVPASFSAIKGGATAATWSGSVCGAGPSTWYKAAARAAKLDGSSDDVKDLPAVDLATQATDDSGAGEGGTVWLTYDEQNLYLTASINDKVQAQDQTGVMIWNGDSLQFAVAAGAPGEATGQQWSELGMALTANGPQTYRWFGAGKQAGVPDMSLKVTRNDTANTTLYEAAIPWSEISPARSADGLVSAALVVNDNDGQGRQIEYEWGTGIANEKLTEGFHAVALLPAQSPTPTPTPTVTPTARPTGAPTPVPTSTAVAPTASPSPGGDLPFTGTQVSVAAWIAVLALAGGGALLAWRRRVRHQH